MCTICLKTKCELGIGAPQTGLEDLDPLTRYAANTLSIEATRLPGKANWSALDLGVNWFDYGLTRGDPVITYTVTSSASEYGTGSYGYREPDEYIDLSNAGEAIVREAFGIWDAAIAVALEDPTTDAAHGDDDVVPTLRAGGSGVPPTAWAYGPGSHDESGDIWFGADQPFLDRLVSGPRKYLGSYEHVTSLHEIGHALGLKHPHQGDSKLDTAYDGLEYTVMSYRSYTGGSTGAYTVKEGSYPQSLMMLDLAMMQTHYGADHETLAGDTVYRFDAATGEMSVGGAKQGTPVANKVFRTLWDGDGTDLIDLSNYATDLEIDLRPGRGIDLDRGGFAQRALLDSSDGIYAPRHIYMSLLHEGDARSLIENARGGSGADIFIGNAAANVFHGGAGADVFTGGRGADRFVLGAGADAVRDTLAGLDGDTVSDFVAGEDLLVVKDAALAARNITYDAGTGLLDIDTDLDGVRDARIDIGAGMAIASLSVADGNTSLTFGKTASQNVQARASQVAGALEAGTLTIGQDHADQWHSVAFAEAIPEARVVMGPLSFAGSDPATVRVRNVTETGFEFQIDEWDYLDGWHAAETVSWIAGSAGTYTLASGQTVAFGRAQAEDDTPVAVALSGFEAAPAVFAQVTSANGSQAVTDRIDAVGASGFTMRMQEEEANDQRHLRETLDWMAIDYATGGAVEARLAGGVTDAVADLGFEAPADDFVFIADMQTGNGSDTAAIRTTARGPDGVSLFVEEEGSADAETGHVGEAVAHLALAEGSYDLFA